MVVLPSCSCNRSCVSACGACFASSRKLFSARYGTFSEDAVAEEESALRNRCGEVREFETFGSGDNWPFLKHL